MTKEYEGIQLVTLKLYDMRNTGNHQAYVKYHTFNSSTICTFHLHKICSNQVLLRRRVHDVFFTPGGRSIECRERALAFCIEEYTFTTIVFDLEFGHQR